MDPFYLTGLTDLFRWPWDITTRGGCLRAVVAVTTGLAGYAMVNHGWDIRWVIGGWLVINISWIAYTSFLEYRSR